MEGKAADEPPYPEENPTLNAEAEAEADLFPAFRIEDTISSVIRRAVTIEAQAGSRIADTVLSVSAIKFT